MIFSSFFSPNLVLKTVVFDNECKRKTVINMHGVFEDTIFFSNNNSRVRKSRITGKIIFAALLKHAVYLFTNGVSIEFLMCISIHLPDKSDS